MSVQISIQKYLLVFNSYSFVKCILKDNDKKKYLNDASGRVITSFRYLS